MDQHYLVVAGVAVVVADNATEEVDSDVEVVVGGVEVELQRK